MAAECRTKTEHEKGRITLAQNEDATISCNIRRGRHEATLFPLRTSSRISHSLELAEDKNSFRVPVTKATSLRAFKYAAGLIRPSRIEATNSSPSNNLNKVSLRELQKIFLPLNCER